METLDYLINFLAVIAKVTGDSFDTANLVW